MTKYWMATKDTSWDIHGKPHDWKSLCPKNDKERRRYRITSKDNPTSPNSSVFR